MVSPNDFYRIIYDQRLKLPYFKLLPALIPFCLFFVGGIALTVMQSFGMMNPLVHDASIWAAYETVLSQRHFLISILFSFYVALMSSTIASVLGTFLAYGIWRLPAGLQRQTIVYKIPLILPHIAVAFITMIFLSQSGLISSLCHTLGITSSMEAFPNLIFSRFGVGEIVAYSAKESAFVAIMTLSVLMKFDRRYIDTAKQLGAGEIQLFFSIVLPHLKGILASTFLILFIYSFGAFEIPYILGNSSPGMLSLQVYDYYFKHDLSQRPVAMALLVILFIVSSLLAFLYFQLTSRLNKGKDDPL